MEHDPKDTPELRKQLEDVLQRVIDGASAKLAQWPVALNKITGDIGDARSSDPVRMASMLGDIRHCLCDIEMCTVTMQQLKAGASPQTILASCKEALVESALAMPSFQSRDASLTAEAVALCSARIANTIETQLHVATCSECKEAMAATGHPSPKHLREDGIPSQAMMQERLTVGVMGGSVGEVLAQIFGAAGAKREREPVQ